MKIDPDALPRQEELADNLLEMVAKVLCMIHIFCKEQLSLWIAYVFSIKTFNFFVCDVTYFASVLRLMGMI